MRRLAKFLYVALILAIALFLGGDAAPGSAEAARSERPPPIEVDAYANSTSSNSSSGSIMITMTGVIDEEGYDR